MRTIIGLLFISISIIGTIFFRRYNGAAISHPTLWYVAFVTLGLLGAWLIYSATRKIKSIVEQHINTEIEKLKSNAEKIELDFDKCDFKSGSFSHEVEDQNLTALKLFAPSSLAHIETTVTENVIQSYLTYTETINGQVCKFISQSFPFDPTTLRFHVLNRSISLYIDRLDRNKYIFDLKR